METLHHEALRTMLRPEEVLRHHLLEGIARRVALAQGNHDSSLVLRGSLALRLWTKETKRRAEDIDFIATCPFDVESVLARVLSALALDLEDGLYFDLARCRARAIWPESRFPGVRLSIRARLFGTPQSVTSDVGFGDPLVPDAEWVEAAASAGEVLRVCAAHACTLAAWKLHGLYEWGRVRWRPKDLLDLCLLVRHLSPVAPEPMASALRAAFESRGCRASDARLTIADPHWSGSVAAARWEPFREALPPGLDPGPLDRLHREVQDRLAAALSLLPEPGDP